MELAAKMFKSDFTPSSKPNSPALDVRKQKFPLKNSTLHLNVVDKLKAHQTVNSNNIYKALKKQTSLVTAVRKTPESSPKIFKAKSGIQPGLRLGEVIVESPVKSVKKGSSYEKYRQTIEDVLLKALKNYSKTFIRQEDEQINKFCLNHLDRHSQFFTVIKNSVVGKKLNFYDKGVNFTQTSISIGLCASCSVQLSFDGYIFNELSDFNEDQTSHRKSVLTNFLKELEDSKVLCMQEKAKSEEHKIERYQTLEADMSVVEEYLSEIARSLEICKAQLSLHLKEKQGSIKHHFDRISTDLEKNIKGINFIHSDIKTNFEAILEKVDDDAFIDIFEGLKQKSNEYSHRIKNLAHDHVAEEFFKLDIEPLLQFQYKINKISNEIKTCGKVKFNPVASHNSIYSPKELDFKKCSFTEQLSNIFQ